MAMQSRGLDLQLRALSLANLPASRERELLELACSPRSGQVRQACSDWLEGSGRSLAKVPVQPSGLGPLMLWPGYRAKRRGYASTEVMTY